MLQDRKAFEKEWKYYKKQHKSHKLVSRLHDEAQEIQSKRERAK